MRGGGVSVGISHPVIEWSPSQQDSLSSPVPSGDVACRGLRPRPSLQQGTQRRLDLPILREERALHPWARGKMTSATIAFWFQEKKGVLIYVYFFYFFFFGEAV